MLTLLWFFLFAPTKSPSWWSIKTSGVNSNLRGVCVVLHDNNADEATVWASGSNGVILRSTNTGKIWSRLHIPTAESLDFRGIRAFGDKIAYVMASGEGAKSGIYKTSDGGKTWKRQYSDVRSSFFLDALACGDAMHCFALSDPVDGKFLLLATEDGEYWRELPRDKMPDALPKEGVFAASNSALVLDGSDLYFGTGGPKARIFHSPDLGHTWSVSDTPVPGGSDGAGIFSILAEWGHLMAVGGDYKNPKLAERNAAYSDDAGKTWRVATTPPAGYRSGIADHYGEYVAVGPSGSDIAYDRDNWLFIDSRPFNAVESQNGQTWAVGPKGTIARFVDPRILLI